MAVEMRFANPDDKWSEIGERVGITRQQLLKWRASEQWEIASREVADRFVGDLAPDAIAALKKAWKKGNPAGALEILRALSLLRGAEVTIKHQSITDLDAEVDRLFAELREREERAKG